MPAQMGGFKSPNGIRKPQVKAGGMAPKKPGKALAGMGGMPGMGGGMGAPPAPGGGMPFKKGGVVGFKNPGGKAQTKDGANAPDVTNIKKMAGYSGFKKGGVASADCMKGGGLAAKSTRVKNLKKKMKK